MSDKIDKLITLVRENQDDPISIRELSKKLKMRQKDILDVCEGEDLNINIGVMVQGWGHSTFDSIGDYTIEDLTYDIHETVTTNSEGVNNGAS